MAKRNYQRSHMVSPHPRLALPCVGGLWEKNDTHWNYEVAISEYDMQLKVPYLINNQPHVKFYPLPSEWISWDELHKNYHYVGKGSITMRDEVSKLEGDK